jgi:hypothetical protein
MGYIQVIIDTFISSAESMYPVSSDVIEADAALMP